MNNADDDVFEFSGELIHETDDAYLVSDGDEEYWLPKSQTDYNKQDGTFSVPVWLAEKKGII